MLNLRSLKENVFRKVFVFLLIVQGGLITKFFAQTADIVSGCAPLQVNFSAPSGSSSFYWDFQDGASSNLQNPTNTFASSGNYQVTFRESTTGPIIGTVDIVVYDKPIPVLSSNLNNKGCVPLAVDFSASSSLPPGVTAVDYQWTFGQGSGAFGDQVQFTYNTIGSYTVTIALTASTPSCNSTISYVNYVGVSNPVAGIITSPSPAMACSPPLNVTFTDASSSVIPLTYSWDFGNGNTSIFENPPAQSYSSTGSFIASLTITDTNNCSKSSNTTISIGSPTANFTHPATGCVGSAITFLNNSSSGNYSWNFGTGANPSSSTQTSPSVSFNTPGTHTITLTVLSSNGACSDTYTSTIEIISGQLNITSSPKPQCDTTAAYTYTASSNLNIVNYAWTFFGGGTSTLTNPFYDYNIPDTTYGRRLKHYVVSATLLATTVEGCVLTGVIYDTVYLVYARFMPDKHQGCAPLTVVFSDSTRSEFDIINYNFRFGDGSSVNSSSPGATHTFTTPGIYPVVMTATNSLGCEDISDTIWIQVGEVLPIDFTANTTTICPKESISFTNTSANQNLFEGWHYDTDGELLSACFTNPNGTFLFDDTVGTFDVTLYGYYNGCLSSITKSNFITINGPLAKFDYLYDCNQKFDIQLTSKSMGAGSISWDLGDANFSTQANLSHTYSSTGDYLVVLSASNPSTGCPISYDSSVIRIRDVQANFLSDPYYCGGVANPFDASSSVDVDNSCNRGYKWIFDDPNRRPITTNLDSEPISFSNSGTNTLTLVVTDVNGCTDTLSKSFEIYNLNANYSVSDNSICQPDTVNFINLTTSDASIASYTWSFGNGDSAFIQNPSYIYTNFTGTSSSVTMIATDIYGCKDDFISSITFYKPFSAITSIPSNLFACANTPFTFSASDFTSQGSNLNFNWDFGDGNLGVGQSVQHTYTNAFNGNVTLYYEELASGCKDSSLVSVSIQDFPVANFITNADNSTALCSPQIINFTNNSTSTAPIVSTNWSFSNGITNTSQSIVYVFEQGVYTAELIVGTSHGCKDTIEKTFRVLNPVAGFTMNQDTICKGELITFNIRDTSDVKGFVWDFGDGIALEDQSPTMHQYNFFPPSGSTVAKLTVYGEGGVCPFTIEQPVYIREVRALFDRNNELDTLLCAGELLGIQNNSTGANLYQWDFGDGTTSSTSNLTFTHSYSYADTFTVTLIVSNTTFGCWDTLSKKVIMNNRPTIITFGDTVCFGETGQLNTVSQCLNCNYQWIPSTNLSNATIANPTANLTQTTIFTVFATDTLTTCSSATDTTQIYVIQNLSNIFFDTTIVLGDLVTLPIDNLNGLLAFTWTPDSALSCLNCSYPTYQGLEEITYHVNIEHTLGCTTAEGTFIIKIFPETFLDLPTTFTPNGDGVNDIIYLKGWGIKELLYFQIFNRWGELVFETSDITVGWNGYYKEILQNNDTYTYKARVKNWKDENIEGAGHINLMR